jgi:WD40 repeat protein
LLLPGSCALQAGGCCALLGVGVGHRSRIHCVATSAEWQVASASDDSSCRIWDTSGTLLAYMYLLAWGLKGMRLGFFSFLGFTLR